MFVVACSASPATPEPVKAPVPAPIRYGANAAASATFIHDGVKLYFETYGQGEPLLLVHGNGVSIGSLAAQIEFFKTHRKAMDSRDHGRSADSDGPIDYEKMTDDLAALIDHLALGPVDVVGWSDDEESDALVRQMLKDMPEADRNSPAGKRAIKVTNMMLKEPHIDATQLARISAPTLVLAADHDLIRTEHIVEIYTHLPNAQLAIFPDSTHMVPYDNPELFNSTVERFLAAPFVKKDRIPDTMKSYEKLVNGLGK